MRINIYRGKSATNSAIINANGVDYGAGDAANGVKTPLKKEQGQIEKLLQLIEKNPSATQAYYAEEIGVSKRTVSRIFVSDMHCMSDLYLAEELRQEYAEKMMKL